MRDATDWERAEESSGTKEGHWVFEPATRRRGLVKKPRYRESLDFWEGEAWAEVLACRVARALHLTVPDVDAVTFEGQVCPISWDCCPRGWELREGVALAGSTQERESLSFEQVYYLLRQHLDHSHAQEGLIRLACFDVLVCNTDRHWQNWGVLVPLHEKEVEVPRMAPYYDNGSAFASNLDPSRLDLYIADGEDEQSKFDHGFRYELRVKDGGPRPRLGEVLDFLLAWDRGLASLADELEEFSGSVIERVLGEACDLVADDTRRQVSRRLLERRRNAILEKVRR